MPTDTPEGLFDALVRTEPTRPFVTYYDETTGERSELSVRSLGNWVAKTYFLLMDELGLGVGDRALVALPAHWISVPAVLGAFTAGLEVTTAGSGEVAFVEPATLPRASGVPDVYAVAPASAAQGFGGSAPAGAADYVSAVRPQQDKWPQVRLVAGPDDPGLDGAARRAVVERARDRAADLGVGHGARVLTTRPWGSAADLLDSLLVPLAVGGSVVVVRGADESTLARRVEQERVTAQL